MKEHETHVMQCLVASSLLYSWVVCSPVEHTEEGKIMIDMILQYQKKTISDIDVTFDVTAASVKVVDACMSTLDITNKAAYAYAILIVLYAAVNRGVWKVDQDDDILVVLTTIKTVMDKATKRNEQLRFSKHIEASADRLAVTLAKFDIFLEPEEETCCA